MSSKPARAEQTGQGAIVGNNVKAIMQSQGVSRRELARRLDKDRQQVDALINGYIESPRLDTLQQYADALNVTVSRLLGETVPVSQIASPTFSQWLKTRAPADLTQAERVWLSLCPISAGVTPDLRYYDSLLHMHRIWGDKQRAEMAALENVKLRQEIKRRKAQKY